MRIEAAVSSVQYETYETGEVHAMLGFKGDAELEKINLSYLSVPVDESVTENGKLCIAVHDTVLLEIENNNIKYYEIRRYTKRYTDLPRTCNVCGKPLAKINTLLRKVKRLVCDNGYECNAHSRAALYRLFKSAGIELGLANLYMNGHYVARITHLWDLVLIYKQNDGDPNTEPRQKMWNGRNELWDVEKKLHEFLLNIHALSNKDFWYIGFGLDLDMPKEYDPSLEYPKVVGDNVHLVKQLQMFFEAFKPV